MGHGRKHRPHRPEELGPRLIRKGRWYACDLRPWQGGRPTMRNPEAAGWPERGERTADPEVAERWKWAYLDLVRDEHRARVLRLPRERRLGDAARAYLEHRSATVERATWGADRTALNHLLDEIAVHRAVQSIETAELQAMLDRMARADYAPSTLYTYRKSLQTFFRWCGPHDPTADVYVRDLDRQDVRTFEADELVRLRTAADRVAAQRSEPNARLAVELALTMGLRQGEVFALRWEAIDADTRSVRVRWQIPKDRTTPKGLKGKRARTALVLPTWWGLHRRDASGYVCGKKGRPIGTRTQRDIITRVLDTAGLNELGLGWHVLRHTYARHFIEQGGRFEELQKSLGHRSIVTTEARYGHYHEDVAVRLAAERIYGA